VSDGSPVRRQYPNGLFTNTFRAGQPWWRSTFANFGKKPTLRDVGREAGTTPLAQLLALFDIEDGGDARMRGCPFHNAAVEVAGVMPAVERIVHLHKRDCADGLVGLARQAGAADPELRGNQVALLYEGASALSTSLNDPTPWARARAAAEALISM
jgi:hypothetical protein